MSLQSVMPLNVDFYDKKFITINAKQYDKNSRFLLVTCYNRGQIFSINSGEHAAYIRYRKSDDYGVFNFCEINRKGEILVELTEQMLASSGMCYADLVIVNKGDASVDTETGDIVTIDNASILSTMTFCIDVTETTVENSEIESSYEYDGLNIAIEKAEAEYKEVIQLARSYAIGDADGIRENEDKDNAKYYYEQAKDRASAASKSAAAASTSESNAKTYMNNALDYQNNAYTYMSNAKSYMETTDGYMDTTEGYMNTVNGYMTTTKGYMDNAESYMNNTNTYMSNAKTSEQNAKTSETNAKNSEVNAKASEEASYTSEQNAKTYMNNAKTYMDNANASEDNAETYMNNAKSYMDNAKISETNAKMSENNSAASEQNAKASETNASVSETNAKKSETNAYLSETNAKTSETNALTSANKAQSYAVGGTGTRNGEDTDNVHYYYEKIINIVNGLETGFIPMGTIAFSELATAEKATGFVYNISDDFVTTSDFREGEGKSYTAGTNVYICADGMIDCFGGASSPTATVDEVKSYLGI